MHRRISYQNFFRSSFVSILILSQLFFSSSIPAQPSQTDSHVITNVPYIGQTTDFYCAYATSAMVLGYYGFNTTVEEVLFNSGVGYALVYSVPTLPRLPVGSVGSCRWEIDRSFLASLYGLHYEEWRLTEFIDETMRWTMYWTRVKENITQNRPVITDVDPVLLPSIRNAIRKQLGVSNKIWIRFSDKIWNLANSNVYHSIVLVGFNEENQTVCFHDPSAELYGHPQEGTYVWMPLETLRKAHRRLCLDAPSAPYLAYSLQIFTNTENPPLNQTDRVQQAYARNIKKLQGNHSVYDHHITNDWGCSDLGLYAMQSLSQHLGTGISNRYTTAQLYVLICTLHLLSLGYKLGWILDTILPDTRKINTCPNILNKYRQIALEKESVSDYLFSIQHNITDTNLSLQCQYNAFVLQKEAIHWTRLADGFSRFLEKGITMTKPRACSILRDMYDASKTIITIQESLLPK